MYNQSIKINCSNYNIKININELWYFNKLIESVENFYKQKCNQNKNVLLKIPGSGKFIKLNKKEFFEINKSLKMRIDRFGSNIYIDRLI
tara:strand:- start:73 stop:339 length:267 start_codon:yes stop_codon:yes gene_type:complete